MVSGDIHRIAVGTPAVTIHPARAEVGILAGDGTDGAVPGALGAALALVRVNLCNTVLIKYIE